MTFEDRAFALGGTDRITDTEEHTGNWCVMEAVDGDAVIELAVIEGYRVNGEPVDMANYTLKEGRKFFGKINKVTLSSGVVELTPR